MKSKKLTYVLIVGVSIVWGLIFYRIYAAIATDDLPITERKTKKEIYFVAINHENDAVTLDLNYRDPFASTYGFNVPLETTSIKPLVGTKPMLKPFVNWSGITYTGYINNSINKQKIVMVTINGKEQTLTEGQSVNGIKLLKFAGDSIRMQYQNEIKYLRIK